MLRPNKSYTFVLNLQRREWTEIVFDPWPKTIVPSTMFMTLDEKLILVKSSNVLHRFNEERDHYSLNWHFHCAVYRVPLGRPESLKNLALFHLNRSEPLWKTNAGLYAYPGLENELLCKVAPKICMPEDSATRGIADKYCLECKSAKQLLLLDEPSTSGLVKAPVETFSRIEFIADPYDQRFVITDEEWYDDWNAGNFSESEQDNEDSNVE